MNGLHVITSILWFKDFFSPRYLGTNTYNPASNPSTP